MAKTTMLPPRAHRFEADVILGHKGVVAAIIPFDPEEAFGRKPVRLAGRRHGWLVEGTVAGVAFDGYVGERWGRFFVTLDQALLKKAKVGPGESAVLVLRPTESRETFARAVAQSKVTTQPGKARGDAVVLRGEEAAGGTAPPEKEFATRIAAARGTTVARLGLRFDRVVHRVAADLRTEADRVAPEGAMIFVTLTAPILQPAKTVAAITAKIAALAGGSPRRQDVVASLLGNHVRLRLRSRSRLAKARSGGKLVLFVHSADVDAKALLDDACALD